MMRSSAQTTRHMGFAPLCGRRIVNGPKRWPIESKREPYFSTIMAYSGICTSSFPESSRAGSAVTRDRLRSIITRIRMASPSKKLEGDAPYKVVRLKTWEDYLRIISDSPYQNWAFRGQRDASAPLFSALSRYFIAFHVDRRAWPDQEDRILRIFKRKAIHFLQHVPDRDDDFQWLALMQDHGAPTSPLDFTVSPYVAAFFALHNTTHEGGILACNPVEIGKVKSVKLEEPGNFRKYFLSGAGP